VPVQAVLDLKDVAALDERIARHFAHQAAEAVWRACGGNGLERQPEAVIQALLFRQMELMMGTKATKVPDEKPQPRPRVQVAFAGSLTEFKVYTDKLKGDAPYVLLPSGRRAYIAERRDGTYMVKE
jgi:hypothetical protein